MALDKDKIHGLVEIFYQKPPFKTFYVNSTDGTNFIKPTGVFVSLGITTSLKVLEDLRDVLNRMCNITARLVEIKSTRISGQFMNSITRNDPSQYIVDESTVLPNIVLSKEESEEELRKLDDPLKIKSEEYNKLKETMLRVSESANPWVDQKIMKLSGGGYRVFHRYVNYRKEDDGTEYRIGIYVEENS